MALEHLKLLINLARIDGNVEEREKKYISTIGLANNLQLNQIMPLFDQDHEIIVPGNINADQRFNYIFSLVQLMKIDDRLYKSEIQYCSRVAAKLGYDETVMFDLMLNVRSAMETHEIAELKKLAEKYLSK